MSTLRNLCVLALALALAAACSSKKREPAPDETPAPPPIVPPPAPREPSPLASGVTAAAAGSGTARIDLALPGDGFEAALFQGPSRSTVYGTLVEAPVAATPVLVGGLEDNVDVFFGMAIRPTGTETWSPVGAIVRVKPNPPIYVDASAPAGGNGSSPATAFSSLYDAMLAAGGQNGRNVWVRDGSYGPGPLFLGPNVHVAGGFDGSFDLAARNPAGRGTVVAGSSGLQIFDVISGGSDASIDGLVVDGGGAVTEGVDITDSDVELRSLVVRGCTDRGVRAKVTAPTPNRFLQVVACDVSGNGGDGLSSAGPIDLRLDQSTFDANGQEGADIDDLQAPSAGSVSLSVTGCRFYGNAAEGLDVDLAEEPLFTAPGTFDVYIENSSFELNGLVGLLIDQEHELAPDFFATIEVRGCVARGNLQAGVHIDADAAATYRLDRLACTANGGDGLLVTSETHAGEVVLTASWLAGNLGYGAHTGPGNKVLVATHCALFGNRQGGIFSEGTPAAALVDSVLAGQPRALSNTAGDGNVTVDASAPVFVNAPNAMAVVSAHSQGTVTVDTTAGFAAGTSVEAADNGERRAISQVNGNNLVLDGVPTALRVPGALWAYPGDDVVDDLRLAAGSAAVSAGITPDAVPAPDCGPHGAAGGGAPGSLEPYAPSVLQLLAVTPPLAMGVGASEAIVLSFDRELDPVTVLPVRVVVRYGGNVLPAGVQLSGRVLTLTYGPGWPGDLEVVLHAGIAASDGSVLSAPLLLPIKLLP